MASGRQYINIGRVTSGFPINQSSVFNLAAVVKKTLPLKIQKNGIFTKKHSWNDNLKNFNLRIVSKNAFSYLSLTAKNNAQTAKNMQLHFS